MHENVYPKGCLETSCPTSACCWRRSSLCKCLSMTKILLSNDLCAVLLTLRVTAFMQECAHCCKSFRRKSDLRRHIPGCTNRINCHVTSNARVRIKQIFTAKFDSHHIWDVASTLTGLLAEKWSLAGKVIRLHVSYHFKYDLPRLQGLK